MHALHASGKLGIVRSTSGHRSQDLATQVLEIDFEVILEKLSQLYVHYTRSLATGHLLCPQHTQILRAHHAATIKYTCRGVERCGGGGGGDRDSVS